VVNEYTSEKLVLSAILVPKIFTIGRNLAKFWQKISLHSFLRHGVNNYLDPIFRNRFYLEPFLPGPFLPDRFYQDRNYTYTRVAMCRAEQLKADTTQLTTDNKGLKSEVDTAKSQLMDLSIELGQLRDDIDKLRDQIQYKDQANGKHAAWGLQRSRVRAVAYSWGIGRRANFIALI